MPVNTKGRRQSKPRKTRSKADLLLEYHWRTARETWPFEYRQLELPEEIQLCGRCLTGRVFLTAGFNRCTRCGPVEYFFLYRKV